ARDAPVLVVCLARPELLEERQSWGGGKLNATSILLEPLSERESQALVAELAGDAELPPGALAQIAEVAEGNPLFLEQMLAMVREVGLAPGEVQIPPTIQALLGARLDRLPPDERGVLERAAVIGKEFWRGSLVDLLAEDERESVDASLQKLV